MATEDALRQIRAVGYGGRIVYGSAAGGGEVAVLCFLERFRLCTEMNFEKNYFRRLLPLA